MTSAIRLPTLAILMLLAGTAGALAQSVGPDEAIRPNGVVTQKLALTAAQRHAIYNAILQQRVKSPANPGLSLAIGAAVPPLVELRELPDQSAGAGLLKYAMVQDEVVVVDPIRMRVVAVIHNGVNP